MTILPPPVDRERETMPPSPSDFPSPEQLALADRHSQRLTAIEASLVRITSAVERIDANITHITHDIQRLRTDRAVVRQELDELEGRVVHLVKEAP